MFLYRSNRSERLVDRLADVIRSPLPDPLSPEVIVVQSKGMERWLAMELSRRLGVFANATFPFPRHLFESIAGRLLGPEEASSAAFAEPALLWSVAALLPELLEDPAFAPLARYLDGDADGRLQLQLAERIARVFDDYSVYRPELLLAWERGKEPGWDAQLWRRLVARHGRGHQAARAAKMLEALERGAPAAAELPQRLCVFGISSLPPLYLTLLDALSRRVETHLFLLSPSREYFGDQRPRRARRSADAAPGHPLLQSLGRLGREFQDLLEERTNYHEDERDLYVDPREDKLLHALQSDILHLRARGADGRRTPIAANDDSIAIHIAHGPMREIEILHDQLTALLEDPNLAPHDIVVMAPDIEVYAKVIDAVFGQSSGRPFIPYAVADRKTKSTHEVVDALYALLDALSGRLTAGTVLDLLALDCIRERFGIASEELDRLRTWVEQSGVRWGADAEHRAEVGQPARNENTWRFGLDRMLLGYALPGGGRALFAGVLPYDAIEGGAAELLGKLAELCDGLFRHRQALREPLPVREHCLRLTALLDDMVAQNRRNAHEHALVRDALEGLAEAASAAGFTAAIDLGSVRARLEDALDARLPARGLLSRGVTFCQLVPMRSIPFKVVCLVGMNDGAFPGRNPTLAFDRLVETGSLPGDRSRRDDDRYMFLEALLCARERLIISYVGRSIEDNRVLPPSVLVGELLDAIAEGFSLENEPDGLSKVQHRQEIEKRLCVVHRLHAYSPRYFEAGAGGGRLFSYSKRDCDAAQALAAERADPPPPTEPLPGGEPLTALSLDDLIEWTTQPLRAFAQRQLGLYLGRDAAPLEDREPFSLDALSQWQIATDLLKLALDGAEDSELLAVARASGDLPLGTPGEIECEELLPDVHALAAAVRQARGGERLPPLSFELVVDGVRVTGTLHELYPGGQLYSSYSKIGRRFELAHFVRHVALCSALAREPRPGYCARSLVVARSEDTGIAEVEFGPLADPERLLARWIAVVRAAHTRPLPFEYKTAFEYAAHKFGEAGDEKRAEQRAAAKYKNNGLTKHDPYLALFYPTFETLLAQEAPYSFAAVTEILLGPLFAARRVR